MTKRKWIIAGIGLLLLIVIFSGSNRDLPDQEAALADLTQNATPADKAALIALYGQKVAFDYLCHLFSEICQQGLYLDISEVQGYRLEIKMLRAELVNLRKITSKIQMSDRPAVRLASDHLLAAIEAEDDVIGYVIQGFNTKKFDPKKFETLIFKGRKISKLANSVLLESLQAANPELHKLLPFVVCDVY